MLKRKAYKELEDWKRYKTKQALLVKGARQVGKTTLVRQFAANNYEVLAEVNFFDNRTALETIERATDVDDLLLRLSVLSGKELEAGKTLVFSMRSKNAVEISLLGSRCFLKEPTTTTFFRALC